MSIDNVIRKLTINFIYARVGNQDGALEIFIVIDRALKNIMTLVGWNYYAKHRSEWKEEKGRKLYLISTDFLKVVVCIFFTFARLTGNLSVPN